MMEGPRDVPALQPKEPFATSGAWLNVDEQIGLINEAGFRYVPAGQYTRRSAAEDLVSPIGSPGHTAMLVIPRASAAETARLARQFSVRRAGPFYEVYLRDGVDGPLVCAQVDLGRFVKFLPPADVSTPGQVSESFGLENLTDGDPTTCTVFKAFHRRDPRKAHHANMVLGFSPDRMKARMQNHIQKWCKATGLIGRTHHALRRTGMELSDTGELLELESRSAQALRTTPGNKRQNYRCGDGQNDTICWPTPCTTISTTRCANFPPWPNA
jgi:hypothetical protein